MKQETVSMLIKGIAAVGAAIALQLANSVGQWANTGEWPETINWIMIISLTSGAGFNALWSFMSGSYSGWQANRNGNGGTTPPPPKQP